MFNNAAVFNRDISGWNTDNITITQGMFQDASSFNGDLSSWNLSNVTNFVSMFQNASSFNNGDPGNTGAKPLTWTIKNTGTVNMTNMFNGAASFNQKVSDWNMTSVTNVLSMFSGATILMMVLVLLP